ncbi:thiamine phosphate synthase [Chromatiaceae bacterium AAb-1]|nr:thiamine phosphate synthase [Chromatiaceae bacterium AAb-1]
MTVLSSRPVVWSIAASDSGGGAGIQADLHTFAAFGCHGCTVISGITAQNSIQVCAAQTVSPALFKTQLDTLATDLPPVAIKIGVISDITLIHLLADWLAAYRRQRQLFVVADPVFASSTGYCFAASHTIEAWRQLLPVTDIVTPNLPELALLSPGQQTVQMQAKHLLALGAKAVLLKGGHATDNNRYVTDHFISTAQSDFLMQSPRINTANNHGTGCVLSAAIAAAYAQQYAIQDAVVLARAYLQQALTYAYATGSGAGSLLHQALPVAPAFFPEIQVLPEVPVPEGRFPALDQSPGLYPVVDNLDSLKQLLQLGAKTLQLRIKEGSQQQTEQTIAAAILYGRKYQAQLFINDHWQLAIKHHAYGVHLGQEDLAQADLNAISQANLRLGISTHGYYELTNTLPLKPSYIALGHIFPTRTKQMPSKPQGLQRLAQYVRLCDHYKIPAVAIGGINAERFPAVADTGVSGIAVVSAISAAADPDGAFQQLQSLWSEHQVIRNANHT